MAPKSGKFAVTTSGKQGQSIRSGEVTSKISYHDKQSDSYGRVTTKQSVSSGDYTYRGRDGHKYEYKASSTATVGDKRGYTEYSKQEKFTRVDHGGGNKFGENRVCGGGGGGYEDHGYSCDDTDAQDDDDYSVEGGACYKVGNDVVDEEDPCDDYDDFDVVNEDDPWDDNDDFDDVNEDDPCDDNDDFDDDDDDVDNYDFDNASVDDDCCYYSDD